MDRNYSLALLILSFLVLIGCEKKYSKKDALNQSMLCLEIKNDLGSLSQERNPYFFVMAENIDSGIKVADSTLNIIKRITEEINEKNIEYYKILQESKPKHKDSRFIDATLDFIKTNQDLEFKADTLIKSLLDSESDKEVEKKIAYELKIATKNMTEFQKRYKNRESDFHNDNGINQTQVDSIVEIIKSKKTIANTVYN
ncbi:hypothetical protein [Arenibacter sp. S6351L]|uniref:hypothetical protein n=1 Tax=Arenibacter sp. S6351L TaxID=2926407 RepID=UPI001FF1DE2D|nr:hypothetical protein [Arenibacter sp. S6351L]MCK0137431.1 hypothetical protein [Arenibacter sp. S6351L]